MDDKTTPSAGGLVAVNSEDLKKLKVLFGKTDKDFPLPFVREIFLVECHIAGTMYVTDIGNKTTSVKKGTILRFQREADNKADSLAIQILNEKNERIGYVPKAKNEILARLMDAGKLIFGQVVSKSTIDDWTKIVVRVLMKDV